MHRSDEMSSYHEVFALFFKPDISSKKHLHKTKAHQARLGKSQPRFNNITPWLSCAMAIFLLSGCQPTSSVSTAMHTADCGSANEAKLPISDERLRAEIEQHADLAAGGYTIRSRCRLDTGQFIVKIMLDVRQDVVGPIQAPVFLVQPDGRVERVKESEM